MAIINEVILNCPSTSRHGARMAEINGTKARTFMKSEPSNTPAMMAR